MSSRISASRFGLLKLCGYSFREDVALPPEGPKPAADFGTLVHEQIERAMRGLPPNTEDARALAYLQSWAEWWPTVKGDLEWLPEQALAVDVVTGKARVLPSRHHRDYSAATSTEIVGTVDALAIDRANDRVIAPDWKTGRRQYVEDAETNAQLAFLGMAASRAHEVSDARVGLAFVGPGGVSDDWHNLYGMDMDAAFDEIVAAVANVPASVPKPGRHCTEKFCDLRATCPATTAALAEVTPSPRRLPIVGDASLIQSPEHAAYQYAQLRAAKAAIDAAWEALRQYADQQGGVDAGNGLTWMKRETKREVIDLEVRGSVEALKSVLGDDWRKAVELTATKSSIQDAVRVVVQNTRPKVTLKEVNGKALDALRAIGAIRVTHSSSYDETKILLEKTGT